MKGPGLTINLPVRDRERERVCVRARAAGAGDRGGGGVQAREKELRRKKGDNGGTSAEHSVEERRTDGERQREALRDSVRKSAIELGLWRDTEIKKKERPTLTPSGGPP